MKTAEALQAIPTESEAVEELAKLNKELEERIRQLEAEKHEINNQLEEFAFMRSPLIDDSKPKGFIQKLINMFS
jgi:seryl-tRNA synthetase